MHNISTRFAQDCSYFFNAQYMRKICTKLYLFPQCAIYAQDLCKIVLIFSMRNICPRFASSMCNICARFVQDCTYFLNVQYMHKTSMRNICIRFVQDCTYFLNAQYLCKICVFNAQYMCKICARLYLFPQCAIYTQDFNAQYMCKICTRLYLFRQCTIYAQDLCKIVLLSPMRNICARL